MGAPCPGSALLNEEETGGGGGVAVSVEDPAPHYAHHSQDEDNQQDCEGV